MPDTPPTAETITRFEPPKHHYTLLRASNGDYLGADDGKFATYGHVDDKAVWDTTPGGFRHVVSGLSLTAVGDTATGHLLRRGEAEWIAADGTLGMASAAANFVPAHGPEKLPSAYLDEFRRNGWVCLNSILAATIIDDLARVSCTGAYSQRRYDRSRHPLSQSPAVARTAAEPVSLWLIRQYLGTDDIRLGHAPSLAILSQDDGERDVQGWHSDFPYLWGIGGRVAGERVPVLPGELVLGVQRNVCISAFTRNGGATAFKLGSHARNSGPPTAWGTGNAYGQRGYRRKHGLPYNGPEADVVEAPPGSIILYDARTWHRAGVNRTADRRAAMLQAVIPAYIMPFIDASEPYKEFLDSPVVAELDERERKEVERLLVHRIAGSGGLMAITVDRNLTERTRVGGSASARAYR